jgi:hypothetical protein
MNLKTKSKPPLRIRVRITMSRAWIWELLTSDGHIAQQSEDFTTRRECEIDALRQGLPVQGLAKALNGHKNGRTVVETATASLLLILDKPGGLWQWQCVDEGATGSQTSTRSFLTKEECVADARKKGYL